MRCEEARATIEAWNPLADLEDDVVGHIDRCEPCREVFDARFPSPVPTPAPAEVARPAEPAWSWASVSVVAAAAIVVLALLPGSRERSWVDGLAVAMVDLPEECHAEPYQPPECPTT